MSALPHDIVDLYLAPVALAVDARLAALGELPPDRIAFLIEFESDLPDWNRPLREEAVLRALANGVDLHGWEIDWHERGIRLRHDDHSCVLGIPSVLQEYIEGSFSTARG